MIFITGDTHRDFSRLDNISFNKDDMLIILGDVGINYFLNSIIITRRFLIIMNIIIKFSRMYIIKYIFFFI